jgi:hypothetical protein
MKPIENGCKARIINSNYGHNGVVVTVICCIGDVEEFTRKHGPRWRTDTGFLTNKGTMVDHMGEIQLQRIDYDGNEKSSWEALKDIWQPDSIKSAIV